MPREPRCPSIRLTELIDAFEFVSVSQFDEHQAYICKETGRIIFASESLDLEEPEDIPPDPEAAGYHAIPHRRDFDLGKQLALSFVASALPESTREARDIFSRKGAYARFKHLLVTKGALETWYAFEARSTRDALIAWCGEVGIALGPDAL